MCKVCFSSPHTKAQSKSMNLSNILVRARPIYRFADIGRYWATANISVLAYTSPISADIKAVF